MSEPTRHHDVDDDDDDDKPFVVCEEVSRLFHIAAPSVVIQFGLFFIFPVAASAVGRQLDTTSLAAFSLGSLLGNLTCLSILEGALTAADTLLPRAFGMKQYEEVGRIVIRGTVVSNLLLLPPIVPLWWYGGHILEFTWDRIRPRHVWHKSGFASTFWAYHRIFSFESRCAFCWRNTKPGHWCLLVFCPVPSCIRFCSDI